jgi:hypothetical protein
MVQHYSDKVCQWLVTCRWFSPSTLVSSTCKTDRHDITEILLKVALSTINQPTNQHTSVDFYCCIFKSFTSSSFKLSIMLERSNSSINVIVFHQIKCKWYCLLCLFLDYYFLWCKREMLLLKALCLEINLNEEEVNDLKMQQ